MEQLLAAHPDFALADRALFWLGQAYLDAHDEKRASASFVACETRFAASEWASRCKKARADVLLGRGHPFAARALYRELAASSDPLARSSGAEGLGDSFLWLARGVGVTVAVVYLLLFLSLQLRALRPLRRLATRADRARSITGRWRSCSWSPRSPRIGSSARPPSLIAVGGALIVWISSVGYEARLERGPMGRWERLRRAFAVAVAVVFLMFLAVQATGLTDLVVETLKARTGALRRNSELGDAR